MFILKWLPFLAKFAGFAKWFSWLPGGQIIGIIGSVAGLIVSFFRWLVRDIEDAFKELPRLVVRLICILAALLGGLYLGIKHDAHKVDAARAQTKVWQEAHGQLLADAKKVDTDDKSRHQKAVAAKLKAEQDERAKIEAEKQAAQVKPAVDPVAKQPDSVQPKRATKASNRNTAPGGPTLQWFGTIFAK